MKKQTITPEMIKEATISYVAEYGLENVTTKKVAVSMEISEGTIFNNFPNKKALLEECFYYIDRQVDVALKAVLFEGLNIKKNIRLLWFSYFNFFVEHGNYAKFYQQFRQSFYFDRDVKCGQVNSFSFFAKFAKANSHFFGFNQEFYWIFLIETSLNFAVRIANGTLPGTPKDIERIYNLISYGFIGNLKIGKKD